MKKMLVLFFLFIVLFNIKIDFVKADIAVWIECDYEVADSGIEKGAPLVLVSGTERLDINNSYIKYRLLYSDFLEKDNFIEEYESVIELTSVPSFDGCWFKNPDDIRRSCTDGNSKELKYKEEEVLKMLRKGVCPAIIRYSDDIFVGKKGLVFAGTKSAKVENLSKQYRFVKIGNNPYQNNVVAEGFTNNGLYIKANNGNISVTYNDTYACDSFNDNSCPPVTSSGLYAPILNYINRDREKFTRFGENAPIEGSIIFDSVNNISKLYDKIDEWFDIVKEKDSVNTTVSQYDSLITTCNDFNTAIKSKKEYQFTYDYSSSTMINDLDSFIEKYKEAYNQEDNGYPMFITDENTPDPAKSAYNYSMKQLLGNVDYVPKDIDEFVYDDVMEYVDKKGLKSNIDYNQIISDLTYCAVNLDKNASDYGLDSTKTMEIRNKYEEFARENDISIIYDCESLIGENLQKKIESYVNIIKIAIPIILIVLGIADFTKATFAGDEELIKKAQKQFINRLLVAVIIFLIPSFVKLLLSIANQVWVNISPDGCSIF